MLLSSLQQLSLASLGASSRLLLAARCPHMESVQRRANHVYIMLVARSRCASHIAQCPVPPPPLPPLLLPLPWCRQCCSCMLPWGPASPQYHGNGSCTFIHVAALQNELALV